VLFVVNPPGTWPSGPWHRTLASLTAPVSFALRPAEQPEPVTFVQGTDIHLHPAATAQYEQYVAHVNASLYHPAFVVHTGDLVRDANRATLDEAVRLFDLYDQLSAQLDLPRREVMGNHEVFGQTHPDVPPDTPGYGKSLYRRRYGPATYAFRYGRYHFIALDATLTAPGVVTYGLTDESAAWATAYLNLLAADEPVVLLVHEPLGDRPSEQRLAALLATKQRVATLCGHGHSRSVGQWAGAPQVMGGAVSYAWHGYQPFPPQPWGYVIWRLADGQAEWAFADWAEERSIDVAQPSYATPLTVPSPIAATVNDPQGDITAASASLAGRTMPLTVGRTAHLSSQLSGQLEPTGLDDGVYDLVIDAKAGERGFRHTLPLVVVTGRQTPFQAAGDATLSLVVTGSPGRAIHSCSTALRCRSTGGRAPLGRRPDGAGGPVAAAEHHHAPGRGAGGEPDKLFLAAVAAGLRRASVRRSAGAQHPTRPGGQRRPGQLHEDGLHRPGLSRSAGEPTVTYVPGAGR